MSNWIEPLERGVADDAQGGMVKSNHLIKSTASLRAVPTRRKQGDSGKIRKPVILL
jgi:hypothetical protein